MVSVIVSVYNLERYIERCVESLREQTFTDYEIVLVDDGSTDSSGAICDEFARMDARITVIHRINGGLSAARNTGLDYAKGEYVLFVDGDDYAEPGYIKRLYEAMIATDADIVLCNYFYRDDEGELVNRTNYTYVAESGPFHNLQALCLFEDQQYGTFFDVVWNKLFRKALFDGIRFPEGISLVEDISIMPELYYRAGRIFVIGDKLYNYIYRQSSLSNGTYEKEEDYRLRKPMMEERLEKYIAWEIKELILMHLIHLYALIARHTRGADKRLGEIQKEYRQWYRKGNYRGRVPAKRRIKFFLAAISLKFYFYLAGQ